MKAIRLIRGTALVLSVMTTCILTAGAQQKNDDNTVLSMERNKTDNSPTSIAFGPSANWRADQANEVFRHYLGITDPEVTMRVMTTTTTPSKITTQRFAQYYKGLKVQYGGYTATIKDGTIRFITGNYYDASDKPSATATLAESDALTKALTFVGAEKYKWQNSAEEAHIKAKYNRPDTSYFPKGQLVWIEDMQAKTDRKLHLAYSFNIYAEQPLSRQEVFVDAQTGKVLFSNSILKHTAASGKTLYSGVVPFVSAHVLTNYLLFDSTRGTGVHTMSMHNTSSYGSATEITSPTNIFPILAVDTTALDAHWGGEMVYDYWLTQQGRHSWDDMDGILDQYVHYSTNYDNAYWDGAEMTYGDGSGVATGGFSSLTSIDVTAHEIGHGVCQATANLIYASESGAMNEGFSDCWAATIENWANPHEVDATPKQPWEIGEEISTEPLRSMSTPLLQGQPNTYGSTNWFNVVACTPSGGNDECGVHTNSGLLNYWYYLLVNGGSGTNGIGNAYIINPLGWTSSATVLYQTELVLANNATYADCRTASINVATTLFGACSPEVQSVTSAWYAVGVGPNYVPCSAQIGFTATSVRVSETSPSTACPATKTITIGIKAYGPAIAGGSAVASMVAASSSTGVAGVDYTMSPSFIFFPPGDISTHNITLTIIDNGAVHDDKIIDLAFTLAAGTSTAVISPIYDTIRVYIDNNDSIPQLGGVQYHTLDVGTPVVSDVSSAFLGSAKKAHSQFLLTAAEMEAAGVIPGAPISQIAFNVLSKSSTAPFTGYTISMKNTGTTSLLTSFVTALTMVYTGNHTTNVGIDSVDFNTGTFTWDGTSNVAVEICFGMNPATFAANDKVAGVQQGVFTSGDYNTSNSGSGSGCPLGFNSGNTSTARPVMRFKQTVAPAAVETAITSNRIWDVKAAQEVYFYNPTNAKLIAGLKNTTNDLGCVTSKITQQGNGLTPAVFSAINRSLKEITITPSINGSITTYDATIYFTNTELGAVSPASLFILKTDAPTDATVSTANSIVVTPTIITGTNYVGFRATFTGLAPSRFMLVDGPLCNTPAATITPAGPTSICQTSTTTLDANTGAGLTYQWQLNSAAIAGATNATLTTNLEGNYTVVVNESVCTNTSGALFINVDSTSIPAITGPTSECIGETVALSDPMTGGTWSSMDGSVASVSATGNVLGVATGVTDIVYTITNLCGAVTTTQAMTVSAPAAVAAITGAFNACPGGTAALSDGTPSGTWSSIAPAVATISPAGVVTAMATGMSTISYSVTNASGCTTAATIVFTVDGVPASAVTPSGPTNFCTGGNVTLSAATGAGLSYHWQSSGTDIPGATSASFNTSTGGIYGVVVTNASGCSATSATLSVVVNPAPIVVPAVTVNADPGIAVCITSSTVTFTPTPANGGAAPTYQWFVNGASSGTGSTFSYTASAGNVVKCIMTSNATCAFPLTARDSVTMTITPPLTPSVTISPSPNDTVCTGDTVTLAAVPVNGGTHPTYLWTENGINVATGPHYIYSPNDGDLLICTMTSNYPCLTTSTAVSPTLELFVQSRSVNSVTVHSSPATVIPGLPATFTAVTPGPGPAATYQWYINGVALAGATSAVYTTSSLLYGQSVSCIETSSLICATPRAAPSNVITVGAAAGAGNVENIASSFSIVPNPNNGTFVVTGLLNTTADKVTITMVNLLGQVVLSTTTDAEQGVINERIQLPPNHASGLYLVNVTCGNIHEVFHVSVNR